MVIIQVKKDQELQFAYETDVSINNDELINNLVRIYNGRLKVERICDEIEQLCQYGPMIPPEMSGLNKEQIEELKLVDYWADKCVPSGGFGEFNEDDCSRRSGRRPNAKMCDLLAESICNAKALIACSRVLHAKHIDEALDLLRGAVTIVYPMKLPPHDSIRLEFENLEDLNGTQASLHVMDPTLAQLWFSGRELIRDQSLADFLGLWSLQKPTCFQGPNNKSKVVVKLSKRGQGMPAREPIISEEQQKNLMMYAHRKAEELKRIGEEARYDDHYLDSDWADNSLLKQQCHNIKSVNWKAI